MLHHLVFLAVQVLELAGVLVLLLCMHDPTRPQAIGCLVVGAACVWAAAAVGEYFDSDLD